MEVFAGRTPMERGMSLKEASGDDDEAVGEGNAEGEECCCNFSSCVDRENTEHEAEEHCAGVAHENARKLKIAIWP